MKKRTVHRFLSAVLAAAVLTALTACGKPEPPVDNSVERPPEQVPEVSTPADPAPAVSAPAPAAQPSAPAETLLTKAQAEAIALNHAGLTAGQVTGLRSEFDVDDGVQEWEVEFRYDGWEYDYEIHAVSGAVRSFDKEWD